MGKFGKWLGGGLGFAMGGPIGGLLGFLVGSMVDSTNVTTSTYSGGVDTTRGDFGVSLLVLIAAVMKAGDDFQNASEFATGCCLHHALSSW